MITLRSTLSQFLVCLLAFAVFLVCVKLVSAAGFCIGANCYSGSWCGADTVVRLTRVCVYTPSGGVSPAGCGNSTTWDKPANLSYIVVEAWGAGGGGNNAGSNATTPGAGAENLPGRSMPISYLRKSQITMPLGSRPSDI